MIETVRVKGNRAAEGECDACGEADCEIRRCVDCGAALCVGEMHEDLCCATGLSRFDWEEMLDDEIRERMNDELRDGLDEQGG